MTSDDVRLATFFQLQVGGWYHLLDLVHQLRIAFANCRLPNEHEFLSTSTDLRLNVSLEKYEPVFTRFSRTSTVLLGWAILETYANLMAEITIAINDGMEGSPKAAAEISTAETDFLREQQTIFNPRNRRVKVRKGVFTPTLDRIASIPTLLAKVRGLDFVLDRGSKSWQKLQAAKGIRDRLTHPRIDYFTVGNVLAPDVLLPQAVKIFPFDMPDLVTENDIFDLLVGVSWYFTSTYDVVACKLAGLCGGGILLTFFDACKAVGKGIDCTAKEYSIRLDIIISDETPPFIGL